jgi:hypothetical protein
MALHFTNIYFFTFFFSFINIYIYISLSLLFSFSPGRFNTQPLSLSFSLSRVTFHAPLLRRVVSLIIECFLIFDIEEWRSELENQLQTYFGSVVKDMWLLEQIL